MRDLRHHLELFVVQTYETPARYRWEIRRDDGRLLLASIDKFDAADDAQRAFIEVVGLLWDGATRH